VFQINDSKIAKDKFDSYFIAEIGTNFYEFADEYKNEFNAAVEFLKAVKRSKANAVKFQIYKAEKTVSEDYAYGQFSYMKEHDKFSIYDYEKLIDIAKEMKLDVIASIFDEDMVRAIGGQLDAIKVASPDITNFHLLDTINELQKPVILSTGFSTIREIDNALDHLSNCEVCIMYTIPIYPTELGQFGLSEIVNFKKYFHNVIGYSDHSRPEVAKQIIASAFLLGANIFEKHFTISRKKEVVGKNDHIHSVAAYELLNIIEKIKLLREKVLYANEFPNMLAKYNDFNIHARRSLYAKVDIQKGESFKDKIIALRPRFGINAEEYDNVSRKRTLANIKAGQPILPMYIDNVKRN